MNSDCCQNKSSVMHKLAASVRVRVCKCVYTIITINCPSRATIQFNELITTIVPNRQTPSQTTNLPRYLYMCTYYIIILYFYIYRLLVQIWRDIFMCNKSDRIFFFLIKYFIGPPSPNQHNLFTSKLSYSQNFHAQFTATETSPLYN